MSLMELIKAGGVVLGFLTAISVLSLAIMIERWMFYRKNLKGVSDLVDNVQGTLKSGDSKTAVALAKGSKLPAGKILIKALISRGAYTDRMEFCASTIEWVQTEFNSRLPILATIGSITPFIGLFGTVLGVMRAFRDLSVLTGAGPSVVAAGIAEALVNTAAGLFVAIPAIIAYNYFLSRSEFFVMQMQNACEEVIMTSIINTNKRAAPAPSDESSRIAAGKEQ